MSGQRALKIAQAPRMLLITGRPCDHGAAPESGGQGPGEEGTGKVAAMPSVPPERPGWPADWAEEKLPVWSRQRLMKVLGQMPCCRGRTRLRRPPDWHGLRRMESRALLGASPSAHGWAVGMRVGWSLCLGPVVVGNHRPDLRPLFTLPPPPCPVPRHSPCSPQPCCTPPPG